MYGLAAKKKGKNNINFGYQQQLDDNEKGYSSQREDGKSEFHAVPARQFATGEEKMREREQSPGRLGLR